MRKIVLLLLLGASLLTATALAAVPSTLGFQSRLTQPDGTPVADNQYSIHFSLYNVESAGTALWEDTFDITTKSGYFNVTLGSGTTPLTGVDFDQQLYIGMAVNGDSEMTPRFAIQSHPYAMLAQSAVHAETATDAVHADHATNVTSATHATNADKLSNQVAVHYFQDISNTVTAWCIADNAVTQDKAPTFPTYFYLGVQRNYPRIAAGQGQTDTNGLATITVPTNNHQLLVTLIGSGPLSDFIYVIHEYGRTARVYTVHTFSGDILNVQPASRDFQWIAVGF